MTRVVRIHSDLRLSPTSIYGLKRENAKYTLLRCYTICTTRCGFVNVAFDFAARKASRHQLHKHVNAHVYLGVLAYYAKQRPSRCWDQTVHVFRDVHVFVAYWSTHVWLHGRGPERHLHVRAHARYTRYRFTCGRTWFAVNRLWFVFPVLREQLHDDNMLVWCCARALAQRVAYWSSHVAGARACPGAAPDCTRAFALHSLRTRYALSWLHVMITSS